MHKQNCTEGVHALGHSGLNRTVTKAPPELAKWPPLRRAVLPAMPEAETKSVLPLSGSRLAFLEGFLSETVEICRNTAIYEGLDPEHRSLTPHSKPYRTWT